MESSGILKQWLVVSWMVIAPVLRACVTMARPRTWWSL